jgi:hypothetical protein
VSNPFPLFGGNCPKNVSRDAKYAVRSGPDGPEVALLYEANNGERWYATTHAHDQLVEMVNAVKVTYGLAPNGPFYVNEYGQVIVPVADGKYYLAGEYEDPIEFLFEQNILSGRGVDLAGRDLDPGDEWVGPHPGIPYVLKAGGADVYYELEPRPNVRRRVHLSDDVGTDAARAFASRIQTVKGWQGGRFYVNEWREIFAPLSERDGLRYLYVGHLEHDDPWFSKPQ